MALGLLSHFGIYRTADVFGGQWGVVQSASSLAGLSARSYTWSRDMAYLLGSRPMAMRWSHCEDQHVDFIVANTGSFLLRVDVPSYFSYAGAVRSRSVQRD
jgi:hypothetical protein